MFFLNQQPAADLGFSEKLIMSLFLSFFQVLGARRETHKHISNIVFEPTHLQLLSVDLVSDSAQV